MTEGVSKNNIADPYSMANNRQKSKSMFYFVRVFFKKQSSSTIEQGHFETPWHKSINSNKQKADLIHIFSLWSPDSISLQPPCRNLGQMLPQPINSSECHALHVMYVPFVYAVGFLFRAAQTNMLLNFYLSNSAKLKRHQQQWKI